MLCFASFLLFYSVSVVFLGSYRFEQAWVKSLVHFVAFITFCVVGGFIWVFFFVCNLNLQNDVPANQLNAKPESKFLYSIYCLLSFINVATLLIVTILTIGFIYINSLIEKDRSRRDKAKQPINDDAESTGTQDELDYPQLRKARESFYRLNRIVHLKKIRFSSLLYMHPDITSLENTCYLCSETYHEDDEICTLDDCKPV